MAFMFEDAEAAKQIFRRWLERFGREDSNEDIHITIIRNVSPNNPHHYIVQIASKLLAISDFKQNKNFVVATRSKVMEPNSGENLEGFIISYQQVGAFYLLPAVVDKDGKPELLFDLAMLKRNLNIKLAADVGASDIESSALRSHEFS
jgi:hypothetical protein